LDTFFTSLGQPARTSASRRRTDALDREADDVRAAPVDRGDEGARGLVLDAVGARLARPRPAREEAVEVLRVHRVEGDARGLALGLELAGGEVEERDARRDFVGLAGQELDHGTSIALVARFAQGRLAEGDDGVGGQHPPPEQRGGLLRHLLGRGESLRDR
jgi:hypothetical protein